MEMLRKAGIRMLRRVKRVFGNKLLWFLVGIASFLFFLVLIFSGGDIRWGLRSYTDAPILICLVLLFVFLMWITGLGKDFINGFRLAFAKKKAVTRMELQRAVKAMEFACRIAVVECVITDVMTWVPFLYEMGFPIHKLGPKLSLLLLSIVYTGILSLVVIPLKVRLENLTISFMEGGDEEQEESSEKDGMTMYFRLRAMGLTDREAEVARLVCCGLSNKEIGQLLYISDTTVKKHMTHILEKIGCDSRESLTEKVKEQS